MFKLFKRTVRDEQTEDIEMYETWIVYWVAHRGATWGVRRFNNIVEKQRFPSKQLADKFAQAIEDAGKLTKTHHNVKVYKQEY